MARLDRGDVRRGGSPPTRAPPRDDPDAPTQSPRSGACDGSTPLRARAPERVGERTARLTPPERRGASGTLVSWTGGPNLARIEAYTHHWPLLITVMPATFGAADVDRYIGEIDALYKRRERFASFVDTTPLASLPGAHERKRLAEWQNETIDLIGRYNVVTTTVVSSALMRGALTAMNWLFRPPNEQVAVATSAEGFKLCLDRMRANGLPITPSLELLVRGAAPVQTSDLVSGAPLRSAGSSR